MLEEESHLPQTVTLHFTEQGQGAPLVLLHGFPLNGTIWHDQARALSDHYRVITPDLRGHGQSSVPDGAYSMELMARDVFQLLDSLGIEKMTLMGHSMGGYVALAAWRLAPERITALGLICSHAWADTDEVRQNRENQAQKVFAEGSAVIASAMLPRLFASGTEADEPFVEHTRLMMLNTRPLGIMGALRGMAARPDSSGLLPDIKVPVLIIAGDSDAIIPLQRIEAMAAALPNATLATIENAGHMPMLEQPQATALAIRTFMNALHPYK
jgi:pimeloyl-ACP methyl ester carboxylesterase